MEIFTRVGIVSTVVGVLSRYSGSIVRIPAVKRFSVVVAVAVVAKREGQGRNERETEKKTTKQNNNNNAY